MASGLRGSVLASASRLEDSSTRKVAISAAQPIDKPCRWAFYLQKGEKTKRKTEGTVEYYSRKKQGEMTVKNMPKKKSTMDVSSVNQ